MAAGLPAAAPPPPACSEVDGRDSHPFLPAVNEPGPPAPSHQPWTDVGCPAPSREVTMEDHEMDVPSTVQSGPDSGLRVGGRKQSLPLAEGCGKEELSKTSFQSPLKSWAAMVSNRVQKELPKLGDLEIREENGRKFIFIPEEMSKPFRFAAIGTFYGGGFKANMEYSLVFKNLRT